MQWQLVPRLEQRRLVFKERFTENAIGHLNATVDKYGPCPHIQRNQNKLAISDFGTQVFFTWYTATADKKRRKV